MLWGELAPEPNPALAAQWYRQAIAVLPMYTKVCVHLAEICSSDGNFSEAEALLRTVAAVGDPEVDWRLADALAAQGTCEESEAHMKAARSGFEAVLERHLLAFADHGAEFYAGSGNDERRALQLARINAANRPTLRAFEQAHSIAISSGDVFAASELSAEATRLWGHTAAFSRSSLQKDRLNNREGAAA
jgi:hypothetical protein